MSVLELTEVIKSYTSPDGVSKPVVNVPSFRMEAKQQLALEGSSGSGKTTFLNLIAGILAPDSGKVEVAGKAVSSMNETARDHHRARHIGYVFQTFNLLQGYTALENVLLGMSFGRGRDTALARKLLEELGLGDRLSYRPRQLSVGQQQRVALARALANRPELVLADEPTGNLDADSSDEALELIRRTCREHDAALLLVSHDRDVLEAFDDRLDFANVNTAAARARGNA